MTTHKCRLLCCCCNFTQFSISSEILNSFIISMESDNGFNRMQKWFFIFRFRCAKLNRNSYTKRQTHLHRFDSHATNKIDAPLSNEIRHSICWNGLSAMCAVAYQCTQTCIVASSLGVRKSLFWQTQIICRLLRRACPANSRNTKLFWVNTFSGEWSSDNNHTFHENLTKTLKYRSHVHSIVLAFILINAYTHSHLLHFMVAVLQCFVCF